MNAVSLIVAHRDHADPWRQRCADWTRARAVALWPDLEHVTADSPGPVFNHAAAFNAGAARAAGEILVLMDDDCTVGRQTMAAAIARTDLIGDWCMAAEYVKLNRPPTEALLDDEVDGSIVLSAVSVAALSDSAEWCGSTSWAGFVVIRADHYAAIGGYDERLSGWAPDDIAFGLTASALVGDPVRVPGSVFHLWHEPAFEAEHGWTDAKHDLKNAYLAAAGDADAIRRVMAGKP